VTPLETILRDRIRAEGPLPVSEFMALALGHPEHGYYRTRDPLGTAGDFTTAPEISQVFGELIGMWLAVMWQQAGNPGAVRLVELGPGRGTLMADILRAAAIVPGFTDSLTVHLMETSQTLRAIQETTLAKKHSDIAVEWHDSFDQVPAGPLLIVANEFLDALPVEQFIRAEDGWRRRCVGLSDDGALTFVDIDDPNSSVAAIPAEIRQSAEPGAISEICAPGTALIALLAERITRDGIAALIVDYGHIRHGAGDTLQAVRGHKFQPVLDRPGEADLTAHVDFAALAKAAGRPGIRISGPVLQGAFLTELGIVERTEQIAGQATADAGREMREATHRLIAADRMGHLFKVMAISNSNISPPPGFLTEGES